MNSVNVLASAGTPVGSHDLTTLWAIIPLSDHLGNFFEKVKFSHDAACFERANGMITDASVRFDHLPN